MGERPKGHDHSSDRPKGKLVTPEDTVESFRGKTDTSGTCTFTYLCSGFGGYDSIHVEGLTKKDTATLTILVRMTKFDSLESGAHYDLIGQYGTGNVESPHRLNHYGTASLIATLKALADTAYGDSKIKLRINDMSLVLGGPFDCSPHSLWNTPHQNHREGANADVDDYAVSTDETLTLVTTAKMKELMRNSVSKPSVINEGNHLHVSLK